MNLSSSKYYSELNILYAAYGRAGKEALEVLLKRIDSQREFGIFCFTYDDEENSDLLRYLKSNGVPYTTRRMTIENCSSVFKITDLIISMHYRNLIPSEVIALSRLKGMNLHPSLLPKYRGTFSAPWTIINNERETGITYHVLNDKFDDGKIILQERIAIAPDDTGYSLFNKLIDLGVNCFEEAYNRVVHKGFEGKEQRGEPSYYPRKVPFGGVIDPSWEESKIERFIRAMNFPGKPAAYAKVDDHKHYFSTYEEYREFASTYGP